MLNKLEMPTKIGSVLFQPKRYKVLYGGRGGTKSWGVARALIAKALEKRIRIGCFREIQNSIKESVHKLLSDQIELLGVTEQFTITDRSISSINGSEFIFEGLFRNVNRIKSLEGIDIAWVEEAEKVSEESWDILTPTIRKDNSEIWVTFNPQFEDDATYKRFVANPPENAAVVQVNYYDNPWLPKVLLDEMEQDKARDDIKYQNKWLGKPLGAGRKIWTAFNRDLHIKSIPLEDIAKRGNCIMAMDPHSHYYPFCLWIAVLPKNDRKRWPEDFHKHVYAEYPTFEDLGGYYHDMRGSLTFKNSLADLAKEIYAKDGIGSGLKVDARYIDPRFAKGSGSWNWSTSTSGIVEQFAKKENGGLVFIMPQEKILDAQRQVIHSDMLYNTMVDLGQFNEPSFSVSPSCKNLIASLQNHRLEEDSERESEKYKDPSDALRIAYSGLNGFEYKNPLTDTHELNLEVADFAWQ